MTIRFFCCVSILIPVLGIGKSLASDEGMEVARQVYFVNHYHGVENLVMGEKHNPVVLVRRAKGSSPRIDHLQRWRNNAYGQKDEGQIHSKDLVVFSKGKLRGTGILVTNYLGLEKPSSMALWLPALRKVRRMGEPIQSEAWGGSIFNYGDLYLRRPEHEIHEILGRGVFEGCTERMKFKSDAPAVMSEVDDSCPMGNRPVIHLKSSAYAPGEGPELGHEWRESWIDAETYADYRSIFYREGLAFKRIDKDWRSMGLEDRRSQYPVIWYGLDLKNGLEGMAVLSPKAVKWNQDLKPAIWTERQLRKIKR